MKQAMVKRAPTPPLSHGNVIFDLDGVVYLGDQAIPGAAEALAETEDRGFRVVFATNNATRTAPQTADRISQITGFPARAEQVVTSALAAARMLRPRDTPALVVGESGLVETLTDEGIALTQNPNEARCVVVGLDTSLTYAKLAAATRALATGARFIGTNPDTTFPTPEGPLLGGGALVAALEAAAGAQAEIAGKPFGPMRRLLREYLGPGPTWVVGDRLETDMALCKATGWIGALVLSSALDDPRKIPHHLAPDHVLERLTDLPPLLA
jgi:HAD superfamily hydrolase (TIGR01450 family)